MPIYHSPAKINLSLDILSTRPDGYHELQSVVHCIGLYDVLSFEFSGAPGLQFSCNHPELQGDDNLCLKAARAFFKATGIDAALHIELEKYIPTGAGLGGGSGNAATTLRALNEHFGAPIEEDELRAIASTLGADVPLFLQGGCVLMEGIGERLSTLPAIEGAVVLIVPDQHASTPSVYRRFDEMQISVQPSTPALLRAMERENIPAIASTLGNDLESAAQSLGIDIELPRALLKTHGAAGVLMSGSGAASFGLFQNEAVAREAAQKIRADAALPATYRVFVAPLVADGIRYLSG